MTRELNHFTLLVGSEGTSAPTHPKSHGSSLTCSLRVVSKGGLPSSGWGGLQLLGDRKRLLSLNLSVRGTLVCDSLWLFVP